MMASNTQEAGQSTRRRTYKKASSAPSITLLARTTSYNDETGLVFDEFEVSGAKGANRWISDYKTPNLVRKKIKLNEEKGARTLAEMVLGKLGLESQELSPESLQALPWTVGEKIWNRICENYAESFYIWRTFSIAYGSDFASRSHRYFLDIKSPSIQLTDYFSGINSNSFKWLTCLRVSPKQISVPMLVALSSIINLSVLDLSDGQLYIENRESTFDIRVMRTWSELATTGRAFQKLRVLMLGWQEKVDSWIFNLLAAFPKLNMFILTDCHKIHHKNHKEWEQLAWDCGWEFLPSKRGVKYLRALLDDKSFYVGNISNLHYESLCLTAANSATPVKYRDRPILECWLGTPRTWTHIIDEFPGTRTILFQKKSKSAIPADTKTLTLSQNATTKREPTSPISSEPSKRVQNTSISRRKAPQHSAASLLAEMGYTPS